MFNKDFVVRVLFFFIPLMIFLAIMAMAGITDNMFMTLILMLAFVWMLQAIYKRVIAKRGGRK